jgi:hypothetical protein
MTLNPRLLVVEAAVIRPEEHRQYITLVTLSRKASARFYEIFPKGIDRDKGQVMDYAREHALIHLGEPGVSFSARRRIDLEGDRYHLGDILTEKKAFDLGYPEPHLDTQCGRIGQLAHCYRMKDGLEDALRSEGLIDEDQAIVFKKGLHVVRRDQADRYRWGEIEGQNNAERPITLDICKPKNGEIPVGCGAFAKSTNTVYDFMTYPPVMEGA